MDIFTLKALIDDLQPLLQGAVVNKAFQLSPDDLLLRLWRRQDLRLLLSVHTPWPRLYLTTARFQVPARPPRFAALLRARLQQRRLREIRVQPYERVVFLVWENMASTEPVLTLIHELQGAQSNILLVNADGIIVDALHHVATELPAQRKVLPGQRYQALPLPPQRYRLGDLTLEHVEALAQEGHLDAPHLQRLVVGLSHELAAELVYRSGAQSRQCWTFLQELRQQYDAGTLSVKLWTTAQGKTCLTVLPLSHCGGQAAPLATADEAVAAFYQPALVHAALAQARSTLQKKVQQRLQKLQKKIANLLQDQQKLESYVPYQHYGTLLLGQRLLRGNSKTTVIDYYQDGQPTITIPLDPRLTGQENAQQYFKKYRKSRQGLRIVQQRLEQCNSEERSLVTWQQQIAQAEDWTTLEAIADTIGTMGAPRHASSPRAVQPDSPGALPYRTFVLQDGHLLYCGKSNRGNEMLLREIAAPEDLWLHAHQRPGAHVILKTQAQGEVSLPTLRQAAALAAFYSQGKDAASVEVIYTQAKNVHKFRGARPGQVQVDTYRTVEVSPHLPDA